MTAHLTVLKEDMARKLQVHKREEILVRLHTGESIARYCICPATWKGLRTFTIRGHIT
jgi:hypothetical protein